ncbi:hypothetical protein EVAR_40764_1 [Eumeta japonica]|uniref:Uncharacterized protein n=1 Tax=Eumeta variegata TaxID=151549 RepID=A0A4C1X2F6_EUMVA|nr:hypothetical protein EVAR_40764_1 [Eumeta japonica]
MGIRAARQNPSVRFSFHSTLIGSDKLANRFSNTYLLKSPVQRFKQHPSSPGRDLCVGDKGRRRRRPRRFSATSKTPSPHLKEWSYACLSWLQHKDGPTRRYRTLTEYRRETTASAVVFRPVKDSFSGSNSALHQPAPSSNGYRVPTRKGGNALVTPLEL